MTDSPPTSPHLFCPHCGYDLTGLTEARCPECGEAFDPVELQRQAAQPTITVGRAVLRTLWVPAVSTVAGAGFVSIADSMGGNAGLPVVLILGGLLSVGLLVAAIRNASRLSREFAFNRGLRLGIAPYGDANRSFIVWCAIGLFCCQGLLSAAGFFGGCACVVLGNLQVH